MEGQKILDSAKSKESQGNYDDVIRILSTSPHINHNNYKRRYMKILCRCYNRIKKYDLACVYALKVMHHLKDMKASKYKRAYAKTQHELMVALAGLFKYGECKKVCIESLNYLTNQKMKDTVVHARFCMACGKVAMIYNDYKSAIVSFIEARKVLDSPKVREQKNSMRCFINTLSAIAECHRNLKQYKESVQVYTEVLKHIIQKHHWVYADILRCLATSYVGIYQYELSHACLLEAYNIFYTLLGKDDTKTKNTAAQLAILKYTLEEQNKSRICTVCRVSQGGPVCGKQSCMEIAWMTRRTDSFVCEGCGERFAILMSPGGKKCGGCSKK